MSYPISIIYGYYFDNFIKNCLKTCSNWQNLTILAKILRGASPPIHHKELRPLTPLGTVPPDPCRSLLASLAACQNMHFYIHEIQDTCKNILFQGMFNNIEPYTNG